MRIQDGESRWEALHREPGDTAEALTQLGVDARAAAHVAEQRALRMYAQLTGQRPSPHQLSNVTIRDRNLMIMLSSVWLDAVGVGVAAADGQLPSRSAGLAQLSESAREIDSLSEDLQSIPAVFARLDVSGFDAVARTAEQRAARLVTVAPVSEMQRTRGTPATRAIAQAMWFDGCAIGARTATALAGRSRAPQQPPESEM